MDSDERALVVGGLNGRETPRFPFSPDDGLPRLLVPALLLSRFEKVPAPGFCIVPAVPVPRAIDSPPERPPAGTAPTRLCCIVCRRLAVCCWNDCGRDAELCTEPKKWSDPLRTVEGDAARPLADRLARDGTTGRLPAIMRAPPNCWRLAAVARTGPPPKRPAFTVDMPRPTTLL